MKDARHQFKAVLDEAAAGGEVVILRHGKAVARVVPPDEARRLPPLGALRRSVAARGRHLSEVVIAAREEERY